MKLVINIPCFNEEKTLPLVLKEIPKKIKGISKIEVQIVDDGSTDKTVEVAKKYGVKRIIRHKQNMGLGIAFKHGVEAALENGVDIFVNTDADNQYPSKYIEQLVQPVLKHQADIVIGNRTPWKVSHFSAIKKFFQYWGNILVRWIAGSDVPDTVSGFRAYSRDALLRLNITTRFSYVLDTIVQAERKGLAITSIPIHTNPPTRESRLFKNIFQHMTKSLVNVLRCYVIYEPFKTFMTFATLFFLPGFFLGARFLYYNFIIKASGAHIQSLILAAILFTLSGLMFVLGIIAELLGTNRKLHEDILYLIRKTIYRKKK
ncbi:MAG: glycosyltransferase family 2 protein [Candidatus Goldbacteria bacterium]|nr:glycosyltransferase family 2 protein [Candidatus Goldiibacteriota bacterium]